MPSQRPEMHRRRPRSEEEFIEGAGAKQEGRLSGKQEGEKTKHGAKAKEQAMKTAHNAHAETYSKQTFVLFDRQVAFLRRLQAETQLATGAKISLSEIVRAMVDALEQSGVDLSDATTEAELAELLAERLRG